MFIQEISIIIILVCQKIKLPSPNCNKQHIPTRSVSLGFKTKQVHNKFSDLKPAVDPGTSNI